MLTVVLIVIVALLWLLIFSLMIVAKRGYEEADRLLTELDEEADLMRSSRKSSSDTAKPWDHEWAPSMRCFARSR